MIRAGVLLRWRDRLPVTPRTPALTLGEGDTPLVAAPTLARDIGCAELWLKVEGQNPTGSFKDRGMVVAVAKASEAGAKLAVCASTGNTSASAAAYCAAAGITCRVVVPEGKVALGKLAQALAHGARIVVLRGNFDTALSAVRALTARGGIALQAQRESGGQFAAVPDEEIVAAYKRLAAEAGVFCEPASAAPVAGLLRLARERPGRFAGQRLVAVLTGHGLKDPQAAIAQAPPLPEPVPAGSIEEALR